MAIRLKVTRSKLMRLRTLALVTPMLAIGALVAAVLRSHASFRASDVTTLPPAGYMIHDTLASLLPGGGTLLVVSDSCATCRSRAPTYFDRLEGDQGAILLVMLDPEHSFFTEFLHSRSTMATRVVLLPADVVYAYTRVASVPVEISIDPNGRVTDAHPTNIGWMKALLKPRHWLSSWARLAEATRQGL